MTGTELLKVERGIYYAALNMLSEAGVPRDMWPLVIDSAAGRIKDEAITAVSMQELDALERLRQAEEQMKEGEPDGEHTARD